MSRGSRAAVVAATAAAVVAGVGFGVPAFAQQQPDAVQKRLDKLVAEQGFPGVEASVRTKDGKVRNYTAGKNVPVNGQVRIGSNTKSFTAVVVLQLVAEGKIDLNQTVGHYLPDVVKGDEAEVTVHQLLQQTSGLPDYDEVVFTKEQDLIDLSHDYLEPRALTDAAFTKPADFPAGTKWEYSNTNYVLAGLIAEKVAKRPIGEQITRRIIEPLRLKDTYWPEPGEQKLRGTHPHGYVAVAAGSPWVDVTEMDPSFGWAAGQLVSTPSDLRTFDEALANGKLLKPAQQKALTTTVPAPGFEPEGTGTWEYGLGFASHELPCGGLAWGHGGDIQGFETRNLVTTDGRSVVVAVTGLPTSEQMLDAVDATVDAALC